MSRTFKIGDKSTLSKAFTESEVEAFARISLDDNPVHLSQEYAESTVFGQRIVHGLLVASLFSGLIGGRLPGYGSVYLGQNLGFKAPVYIDEKVEASVEVVNIREDKPILTLRTLCVKSDGTVAIEGEAVVKVSYS